MLKLFRALALLALAAAPLAAQEAKPFVRDVAHSQINFVADARLVSAHGTFDRWDAEILFNPEELSASSVKFVIDAKSINTRVERRDNHLRSNDFFATDSFPTITFTSTIINKLSDERVNITGDLTIRGRTRTVTVPSRLVFFDAERNVGRVRGTFTIDRQEYGVSFNSMANPIDDEVQVQFDIAFQQPRTP